jgi:hypothetical protein
MPRFAPVSLFLLLGLLALPAWAATPTPAKPDPAATATVTKVTPAPTAAPAPAVPVPEVAPATATPPTAAAPPPAAEPDDPYTVPSVAVDVKGSSGVDARDKAFTAGGRTALKTLAAKLTGVKEPDLKGVDDNSISRMIRSFEVESEKASGSRYIGKLTFHFRPEVTDAFLEAHGLTIKPTDIPTDHAPEQQADEGGAPNFRMIVLPVVRLPTHNVLFEEKTAWARAWENYLSDNPDPNFVVPEGTGEDMATMSAANALAGIPGPLTRLMQQHDAHGVIVAVLASPSIAPEPNVSLSVQLATFDARGQLRNTSSFALPAQPQRKAMEWLQDAAAYAVGLGHDQNQKTLQAMGPNAGNMARMPVARAAGILKEKFLVPYVNVTEWQGLRSRLQEMPGVMRLDVMSMTHSQANVLVAFRGTRADLDAALAQKGLHLENGPKGSTLAYSVAVSPTPTPAVAPAVAPAPVVPPASVATPAPVRAAPAKPTNGVYPPLSPDVNMQTDMGEDTATAIPNDKPAPAPKATP